eukprot:1189563-Prorocentrum_minimum.AAC.3
MQIFAIRIPRCNIKYATNNASLQSLVPLALPRPPTPPYAVRQIFSTLPFGLSVPTEVAWKPKFKVVLSCAK